MGAEFDWARKKVSLLTFSCVPNLINRNLNIRIKSVRLVIVKHSFNDAKSNKTKRRKLHKCVCWCILKAGQMFQMILFLFSFILFFFFVDDQMCSLFPVCTHRIHFFMSPQRLSFFFPFRRSCVNWSRGRQNWFLNHILWRFILQVFLHFHLALGYISRVSFHLFL